MASRFNTATIFWNSNYCLPSIKCNLATIKWNSDTCTGLWSAKQLREQLETCHQRTAAPGNLCRARSKGAAEGIKNTILRENSWKRPELTMRLWIPKCHNNFRQVFNFANLAHGTSGTRDTNMYKQCTNSKNLRMPNATVARFFEPRGLLCSVTKPQLPSDDTLYIFLPAWTWKSWYQSARSASLLSLLSCPLSCIAIMSRPVSSWNAVEKANACDWGSLMMQSSGLKSSPQTESWNFGVRNQPHFTRSIQFRSTLG